MLMQRYSSRTPGQLGLLPELTPSSPPVAPASRVLRLRLSDIIILYMVRFPASSTRQAPVAKSAASIASGYALDKRPLIYTPTEFITDTHPYFDHLFNLLDRHFLCTNAPPDHPEAGLFLSAVCRCVDLQQQLPYVCRVCYWLLV
jgi:hypothetical protein